MLSACMEYEDMLSDKQSGGCSAVYFGFKILILGSGGKAHPSPFPSKARLPVAFPKGREPDCSAVYFGFKILILGSGG